LVFLIAVCCLQFLLDEPRAMLIAAELNNMLVNVLFRLAIVYGRQKSMNWTDLELVSLACLVVGTEVFEKRTTNYLTRIIFSTWIS
jgi:hypothetical protein